jgi:chemotaxis protein MotB
MIEGHTDNVSYRKGDLLDNWDLSTKRATSIVRVLQNDFKIDPARMTAAGRAEYAPITDNDSADGRAANRRTRIIILPKIDQFYGMIEEGLKEAE